MRQEIDDDIEIVADRAIFRSQLPLPTAGAELADRFGTAGRAHERWVHRRFSGAHRAPIERLRCITRQWDIDRISIVAARDRYSTTGVLF